MNATWVYCIVSSAEPPQTANAPAGPPGAGRVRALDVRPGRYLIVSDAPLDRFGEAPLAAGLADLDGVSRVAVAHEAVTESFMASSPVDAVVPMKLFTLFANDARALAQVRSSWRRIDVTLRRLRRHEEWGVRLVFDATRAPARADAAPGDGGSGRSYLQAKRQQRRATAARATEMRRVAGGALKTLGALARDVQRRAVAAAPEGSSRLLLDAAFLVPRAKATRFRALADRYAKKIAPGGYALQLSGPWPPYSFAGNA
ncbi:MAG TPA: GvpL/GvpF family gas vesicle protein [Vicinamibacterales bacterium]|nr:GvpL/GvpF family gas vesicle protein [Vicinamibacterales bacterium]